MTNMEFQTSREIEKSIGKLMGIKNKNNFIKELGNLTATLVDRNYPYIKYINQEVREKPNGQISFTLRTYQGDVQDIVIHSLSRIKLK